MSGAFTKSQRCTILSVLVLLPLPEKNTSAGFSRSAELITRSTGYAGSHDSTNQSKCVPHSSIRPNASMHPSLVTPIFTARDLVGPSLSMKNSKLEDTLRGKLSATIVKHRSRQRDSSSTWVGISRVPVSLRQSQWGPSSELFSCRDNEREPEDATDNEYRFPLARNATLCKVEKHTAPFWSTSSLLGGGLESRVLIRIGSVIGRWKFLFKKKM